MRDYPLPARKRRSRASAVARPKYAAVLGACALAVTMTSTLSACSSDDKASSPFGQPPSASAPQPPSIPGTDFGTAVPPSPVAPTAKPTQKSGDKSPAAAAPLPEPPLDFGGVPRLPQTAGKVSGLVGRQNAVFADDLKLPRTVVYGTNPDDTNTMTTLTIAARNEEAPEEFVRSATFDLDELPVSGISGGAVRCWADKAYAQCLWGDDTAFLAVISVTEFGTAEQQKAFVAKFVAVQRRMFGG